MQSVITSIRGFFFLIICLLLSSGSSLGQTSDASLDINNLRPVTAGDSDVVSAPALLRTRLPDNALAYLRVPSLWALLGKSKGGVMTQALESAASIDAIMTLRQQLQNNILTPLMPQMDALSKLLLTDLRSPLEAALLVPAEQPMNSQVLLSAKFSYQNVAELQPLLASVIALDPRLQWQSELNEEGYGSLSVAPFAVIQIHFDVLEQRLYMLAAQALPGDALKNLSAALKINDNHTMHALEAKIDQSGQGLFAWVDAKSATGVAQQMLPPQQLAMLQMSGALELRGLAAGVGVSDGKGRTKLIVDMPKAGFRNFIPSINAELDLEAAGKPGAVAMLGLPSAADLAMIEQSIEMLNPPGVEEYREFKEEFKTTLGFALEEWFEALGPELMFVYDRAGPYSAIRLRDADKFAELIELLQQRHGFKLETREIQGNTYHHLMIPNFLEEMAEEQGITDLQTQLMMQTTFSMPSHIYWKQEENYLILASIPQVLMDRDYIGSKTIVRDWLSDTQKFDGSDTLLGFSLQVQSVSPLFHAWNLQLLQFLGDIVKQPIDLFALPSALELQLPDDGSYSLKLASNDDYLTFEIAYEVHPLEFLMAGNSMAIIAAAGVVAAVAIPAYEDYTTRSEVSEGMLEAEPMKYAVAEFYQANGRFPDQEEFAEMLATEAYLYMLTDISIDSDSGMLTLFFSEYDFYDGHQVFLTPMVENGNFINWQCSADLADKWLPASCR